VKAERIRELSQHIPNGAEYFSMFPAIGVIDSNQSGWINKFVICYKDLSFGYNFVRSLVKSKKRLPPIVRERYIREAYRFETTGKSDPCIVNAYMYYHPSNQYFKNLIESFLLVEDITFEEIAKRTGIPANVIAAYEQLFFNIADRKKEAAFIASVVYPESRIVETDEGYLKNESREMLLKRSAYNNGAEDLGFFLGLRSNYLKFENSVEMAEKLESAIMANGLYLARNGFLNQRSATGVQNAKNIISASKQGGQDNELKDTDGIGSIGGSFMDAYMASNEKTVNGYVDARKKMDSD
jgi:hypothetical protein